MLLPVPRTADYKRIDVYIAARRPVHPCDRGNSCARRVALQHVRAHADIGRGTRVINIVRIINICGWKNVCSPSHKPIRRTSRVSDSNSIALLERTSLTVYEADIFNCSRPRGSGIIPRGLRPILLTPGVWQVSPPVRFQPALNRGRDGEDCGEEPCKPSRFHECYQEEITRNAIHCGRENLGHTEKNRREQHQHYGEKA